MADLDRLARIGRSQASDLRVAARGADVTSTERTRSDLVKEKYHSGGDDASDVLGPTLKALGLVGTFAGGTLRGFKQIQEALGEGSRDVGFEHGGLVLGRIANEDGAFSVEAVRGARDAVIGPSRSTKDPAYTKAFERVRDAMRHLPENQDVYPRTRNGFRGGVIAAVAIVYAAVAHEPMLTRMTIAMARSHQPGWTPASLVYGQREAPAHSVLEAVKEITERTLAGAQPTLETLDAAQGAVASWMADLEQAVEGSLYGGPEEALGAAAAATQHLDTSIRLIASAIEELSAWAKEL